jgi:hypothetical protein
MSGTETSAQTTQYPAGRSFRLGRTAGNLTAPPG